MKYYNITVNGKVYSVAVEETTGGAAPAAVPAAAPAAVPAAKPAAPAAAPAPAPAAAPVAAGDAVVTCPMPGTILSVNIKAGDSVKEGDVMLILEAMKMENEILAPMDGVVSQVSVTAGSAVNTGDTLVVL